MQEPGTSQSGRCGASCPQTREQRRMVQTLSSLCLAGLDENYSLGKGCRESAGITTSLGTTGCKCTWQVMQITWGAKPVRCLRWLLTRLDFLMIEWKLSLEIFSMRLSSSPFRYFSTREIEAEIRTLISTMLTLNIYSHLIVLVFISRLCIQQLHTFHITVSQEICQMHTTLFFAYCISCLDF